MGGYVGWWLGGLCMVCHPLNAHSVFMTRPDARSLAASGQENRTMMRNDGGYHAGFETVRAMQRQLRDERAQERGARKARAGTTFPGWIALMLRKSICALPLLISKVLSRGRLSGRWLAVPDTTRSGPGRLRHRVRSPGQMRPRLKPAGSVPVDHVRSRRGCTLARSVTGMGRAEQSTVAATQRGKSIGGRAMPRYMVERHFPQGLQIAVNEAERLPVLQWCRTTRTSA